MDGPQNKSSMPHEFPIGRRDHFYCMESKQVLPELDSVGSSGRYAGSTSEDSSPDENNAYYTHQVGHDCEEKGERVRDWSSNHKFEASEKKPFTHPIFALQAASPVAECIRASFLADIEKTKSLYYTTADFAPIRTSGIMQSTSLIKTWSTPEKTVVSGHPPGPEVTAAETARSQVLRQDVRVVTPMYKTESTTVSNGELRSGLNIHREARLETRALTDPDYKIQREQEHYRLQIIDPKVESHAHVPAHSYTLPSLRKRNKTPDFPSAHSKRSFTKLDPLEQRRTRVKSVEVKQITPHDYLSESLERHRAMSMSPLQDKLRVNERDVNQHWDKPPHPGPRVYSETHEINETTSTSFIRRHEDHNRYLPLSLPPPQPQPRLEDRFQSMGIVEEINDEDERYYRRIRFGGGSTGGSTSAGGGTSTWRGSYSQPPPGAPRRRYYRGYNMYYD